MGSMSSPGASPAGRGVERGISVPPPVSVPDAAKAPDAPDAQPAKTARAVVPHIKETAPTSHAERSIPDAKLPPVKAPLEPNSTDNKAAEPDKTTMKEPEVAQPKQQTASIQVKERPTDPRLDHEEFEIFKLHDDKPQREPGWSDADEVMEYGAKGKPIPKERLQEVLDEDPPQELVPSKAVRHEVVKNPDGAKQLPVAVAAMTPNTWYIEKTDIIREGKLRPIDEWTDGKDFPGADMERGDEKPLELPRGIQVVDTGLEVTDELWAKVLERYEHLPPQLQHAILGSLIHGGISLEDMAGDARREVRLPSGILIGSQKAGSMDGYRPGEIADVKPKSASLPQAAPQLLRYGLIMTQKTGIPHDLVVLLYGKDVTKK